MADVVAISLWLMLLPLFDVGRCYCHILADVVAIFVADVIATFDVGRCYCHVWLRLLPWFCLLVALIVCQLWLMLLPLLLLADVIAMFG